MMPMPLSCKYTAPAGRVLLAIAAGLALYMAALALSRAILPGGEPGTGCHEVMHSRWAFVFGLPVSFPGFVLYSLTLLGSWRARTPAGWLGGAAVATVLAGAAWFTAIQVFVLQSVCLWCGIAQGCAVAGALLLWSSRKKQPDPDEGDGPLPGERGRRFYAPGVALAGVGLMALGSLPGFAVSGDRLPAASAEAPVLPLAILGGKFQLDTDGYSFLGSAAKTARTAVLLNDYTSEACRKSCRLLPQAIKSLAPDVRIILLPAARSPEAEKIQRTLAAVYQSQPGAWQTLSTMITSGRIILSADEVERAALDVTGAQPLEQAARAHAGEIDQQIRLAAAVMQEMTGDDGAPVLPQLILGSRVLACADCDETKLSAFLRDDAPGLSPPDGKALRPFLTILEPDVQLPDLTPGQPHVFQIKVRNSGGAPLKLGWLAMEQGCEVTALPPAPIPPGEIAAIGLRITLSAEGGEITRTLKINSDSPGAPALVTLHAGAGLRLPIGS